jgi:peptidoglycan-N-acetylglucosamine deacetylase
MPKQTFLKIARYLLLFLAAYAVAMGAVRHLPSPWNAASQVGVSLLFLAAALFILDMTLPGFNLFSSALCRLPDDPRDEVALTFDDGPVEPYTRQILDILDRYGAKATFFCLGENVERFPDLAREIVRRGHAIGNHTFGHRILPLLSSAECERELVRGRDAIERATGVRPLLVRTPKGYKSARVARIVSRLGGRLIGFSYPIFDVQNPPPEKLVKRLLSRIDPGDIVVMHDGSAPRCGGSRDSLVAALPEILEGIQKEGLRTVSLDRWLSTASKPRS